MLCASGHHPPSHAMAYQAHPTEALRPLEQAGWAGDLARVVAIMERWTTPCGTTSTPSPPSTGPCSTASTGGSLRRTPTLRWCSPTSCPPTRSAGAASSSACGSTGCRSTAGSRAATAASPPATPSSRRPREPSGCGPTTPPASPTTSSATWCAPPSTAGPGVIGQGPPPLPPRTGGSYQWAGVAPLIHGGPVRRFGKEMTNGQARCVKAEALPCRGPGGGSKSCHQAGGWPAGGLAGSRGDLPAQRRQRARLDLALVGCPRHLAAVL